MNMSEYRLRNEHRKLLKTKQREFYVRKNPIPPTHDDSAKRTGTAHGRRRPTSFCGTNPKLTTNERRPVPPQTTKMNSPAVLYNRAIRSGRSPMTTVVRFVILLV